MTSRKLQLLVLLTLSGLFSSVLSQSALGPARGFVAERATVSPLDAQLFRASVTESALPWDRYRKHPPPLEDAPSASRPDAVTLNSDYQHDHSVDGIVPSPPPFLLTGFGGIGQVGNIAPPDPVIAAGPRHLVQAVNSTIRITDKFGSAGQTVGARDWYATTLQTFFQGDMIFDPRVQYDHFARRWWMLWHYRSLAPPVSYYLLSLSDTDDPSGTWQNWALPADVNGTVSSANWADNGCLGLDSLAIYIVSDQYTYADGKFDGVKVRILLKSQFFGKEGQELTWTDFWNLRSPDGRQAYHVRPSIVHGPSADFFLLEVPGYRSGSACNLFRITDPAGSPALTASQVTIGGWTYAFDAGQPGTTTRLDISGSTLTNELYCAQNMIWAAHVVANPFSAGYSALRYFCINTSTLTVVEDLTFGAPGYWYFYPAIVRDQAGNLALAFNRSGQQQYAGAYLTVRKAGDPAILAPSRLLHPGLARYEPPGANPARWGDYSTVALDPEDLSSVWVMTEHADSVENRWATWVTEARLTPFPVARLHSDRPSIDCGHAIVGEPADTTWATIRNAGLTTLSVSQIAATSADFDLVLPSGLSAGLGASDSLRFGVVFTPHFVGSVTDTLSVTSNDPFHPLTRIPLSGIGISLPPPRKGQLYALLTDRSGNDLLYALSDDGKTTGNAFLKTPLGLRDNRTITMRPSSGRIYGIASGGGGTQVLLIDTETGVCYRQQTVFLTTLSAVAFAGGDTLYGGTSLGGFYRLDLSTGNALLIGTTSGMHYAGLAFDPPSHRLWATSATFPGNDTVYSVNSITGIATPVSTTSLQVRTQSLSPGPTQHLYGLVDNAVIRFDPQAGGIHSYTLYGVDGLRSLARDDAAPTSHEDDSVPLAFAFEKNFPNPFNPSTRIGYTIPSLSEVTLRVFDIMGREVATLVRGAQVAGRYETVWEGRTNAGIPVASGVYFCRLEAGSFVKSQRMMLLK